MRIEIKTDTCEMEVFNSGATYINDSGKDLMIEACDLTEYERSEICKASENLKALMECFRGRFRN